MRLNEPSQSELLPDTSHWAVTFGIRSPSHHAAGIPAIESTKKATPYMFFTPQRPIHVFAPLALACGLLLTGCSITIPTDAVESAETTAPAENNADETSTDFEIVAEDSIMTGDDALDQQLAEFSSALTTSAAPGVSRILVHSYGADTVNIQVWTDEESGVLTGAQLKPVLDAVQALSPASPIGEFVINGWDAEGMQGESNGAAVELGVKPEFIDAGWWNVVIPGAQAQSIYA